MKKDLINKINLYNLFKIDDDKPFTIITNDGEEKICKMSNGSLLEDVGYFKGKYYSISSLGINDIASIVY
jgi:hypothetical protein